jgi:hypothetical protein
MEQRDRFAGSYWAENWERTYRRWKDRQDLVKFAILLFFVAGLGWLVDQPALNALGLMVAGLYLMARVLVITPAEMWDDATRTIAGFKDRLRPRLSVVFKPSDLPYQQHFPMADGRICRLHRIGIQNESAAVIRNVRAVVEAVVFVSNGEQFQLATTSPLPLEHALNVMGLDRRSGFFDLAPGPRPTAYVDLVEQWASSGRPEPRFSLCYANRFRSPLQLDVGPWVITVRVEGGRAFAHAQFVTSRDASGNIVLSRTNDSVEKPRGQFLA